MQLQHVLFIFMVLSPYALVPGVPLVPDTPASELEQEVENLRRHRSQLAQKQRKFGEHRLTMFRHKQLPAAVGANELTAAATTAYTRAQEDSKEDGVSGAPLSGASLASARTLAPTGRRAQDRKTDREAALLKRHGATRAEIADLKRSHAEVAGSGVDRSGYGGGFGGGGEQGSSADPAAFGLGWGSQTATVAVSPDRAALLRENAGLRATVQAQQAKNDALMHEQKISMNHVAKIGQLEAKQRGAAKGLRQRIAELEYLLLETRSAVAATSLRGTAATVAAAAAMGDRPAGSPTPSDSGTQANAPAVRSPTVPPELYEAVLAREAAAGVSGAADWPGAGGWLEKRGKQSGAWKARWFALEPLGPATTTAPHGGPPLPGWANGQRRVEWVLRYYGSEQPLARGSGVAAAAWQPPAQRQPKGQLLLQGASVQLGSASVGLRLELMVREASSSGESFVLRCESPQLREEWAQRLRRAAAGAAAGSTLTTT
jgi:hypothetical protein